VVTAARSGHSAACGGASGALRRRDRWGQRSPRSALWLDAHHAHRWRWCAISCRRP